MLALANRLTVDVGPAQSPKGGETLTVIETACDGKNHADLTCTLANGRYTFQFGANAPIGVWDMGA
jgi:hypothetical protein